ncbi:hypothetical protein GQ42DRAFT_163221 [Ramicandelaber brevisporus]|nr:hypothetical protein GQ42DRAFT_163221 [Ramicandelaber brevisporus]
MLGNTRRFLISATRRSTIELASRSPRPRVLSAAPALRSRTAVSLVLARSAHSVRAASIHTSYAGQSNQAAQLLSLIQSPKRDNIDEIWSSLISISAQCRADNASLSAVISGDFLQQLVARLVDEFKAVGLLSGAVDQQQTIRQDVVVRLHEMCCILADACTAVEAKQAFATVIRLSILSSQLLPVVGASNNLVETVRLLLSKIGLVPKDASSEPVLHDVLLQCIQDRLVTLPISQLTAELQRIREEDAFAANRPKATKTSDFISHPSESSKSSSVPDLASVPAAHGSSLMHKRLSKSGTDTSTALFECARAADAVHGHIISNFELSAAFRAQLRIASIFVSCGQLNDAERILNTLEEEAGPLSIEQYGEFVGPLSQLALAVHITPLISEDARSTQFNDIVKRISGIYERIDDSNAINPELYPTLVRVFALAKQIDTVERMVEKLVARKVDLASLISAKSALISAYVANPTPAQLQKAERTLLSVMSLAKDSNVSAAVTLMAATASVARGWFDVGEIDRAAVHLEYILESAPTAIKLDEYSLLLESAVRSLCAAGNVDQALSVFQRLTKSSALSAPAKEPDVKIPTTVYNSLISALVTSDRVDDALSLFHNRLASVLSNQPTLQSASAVMPDMATFAALIRGYGRKGDLDECAAIFSYLHSQPDRHILTTDLYSAIITVYAQADRIGAAFSHLGMMHDEEIATNADIYIALIAACGRLQDHSRLKLIRRVLAVDTAVDYDLAIYNTLLKSQIQLDLFHSAHETWEILDYSSININNATISLLCQAAAEFAMSFDVNHRLKEQTEYEPRVWDRMLTYDLKRVIDKYSISLDAENYAQMAVMHAKCLQLKPALMAASRALSHIAAGHLPVKDSADFRALDPQAILINMVRNLTNAIMHHNDAAGLDELRQLVSRIPANIVPAKDVDIDVFKAEYEESLKPEEKGGIYSWFY